MESPAVPPGVVVGHIRVWCGQCPWPLFFAKILDVGRYRSTGVPYMLTAEAAGVLLALRVHMRQHDD